MNKPNLYGPAFSTYCRTVRMALVEKGVDYNLIEVDFLQGPMPAEQLERQPFGKVPAFEHDGFDLYETSVISRYIDETFDGPALQPDNVQPRARMNQIISVLDNYTYPCTVMQLVIQRLVMPMLGNQPDETAIAEALPEIDKCMGILMELRGNNTYLAGSRVSLADLHFAPIYDYFQSTPESVAILNKYPGLVDWWSHMSERESVQNTPFMPG